MEGYKERCRKEYEGLCERLEKLDAMLDKWNKGELDFDPACPKWLLLDQSDAMRNYKGCLEQRNKIEHMW